MRSVFGERNAAKRVESIHRYFAPTITFCPPGKIFTGIDELAANSDNLQKTDPDAKLEIGRVWTGHDAATVSWTFGKLKGHDFFVVNEDGTKIERMWVFVDGMSEVAI